MSSSDIGLDFKKGESARLIPVVDIKPNELRTTSVFLAVFMSVEEFGKSLLQIIGAPSTKTSRVECFTEVTFEPKSSEQEFRPDGLIVVTTGKKRKWSAIIEAKIGRESINQEQIENYLNIARENNIDAVITISNQFTPLPTIHPIQVDKRKTRGVTLYHWSWTLIKSEANLLAENKGISDPDQAFILTEFFRYLHHKNSGVIPFTRMGESWQRVCRNIRQSEQLFKNDESVINTIGEWHQLLRYLSLQLSVTIGRTVSVHMSRAHAIDPGKRLLDSITTLIERSILEAEFTIPDAASRLKLVADLKKRRVCASMYLQAPNNPRPLTRVNWVIRQVSKYQDELSIRAIWPGRTGETCRRLSELKENPKLILAPNPLLKPKAFEIEKIWDDPMRFNGAKTFVAAVENLVHVFYGDVGQDLKAWVPPAPKVREDLAENPKETDTKSQKNDMRKD